jgi:hypothetical protein
LSLLLAKNADPSLRTLVETEYTFLFEHKSQVSGIGTLEDAVTKSKEVETKHVALQLLAKKITASVNYQKLLSIKEAYLGVENDATALVQQLKLAGHDVTTEERWLIDAKSKVLLADVKLAQIASSIPSLSATSLDNLTEKYTELQFVLFEANQYLNEALRFMSELSDSIKYGNY